MTLKSVDKYDRRIDALQATLKRVRYQRRLAVLREKERLAREAASASAPKGGAP